MRGLLAVAALAALPTAAEAARRPLVAEATVLAEWRKAENRRACAPIAFAADGAAGGRARKASFSGGWGIAFDRIGARPPLRSAYGIAGAGHLPQDDEPFERQRESLTRQWPYARALPRLGHEAFAGYGAEGAQAITGADPQGRGQQLLAYVRVPGQRCLYNVWTRLGRAHLETLLDGLRLVPITR